ncbi:cytidine and deoxycytidylate deaminase zinc-binding domain protein [Zymoseptoria brevis]|uniref:Cytidine and deoxycytidylate deaminase zinc-binding domain protein n=1 Tax=Zymoseptoria brevis TaxID=1047168 RepID=A0A0F4GEQ3_9PEZI|nr:cytidine and deoxycytidylate deaminase zinc-binding domain protein [Zymoseptoria brevis]
MSTSTSPPSSSAPLDHTHYLHLCLAQARLSPPKPTNFRVGALLLSPSTSSEPLITGYTLECPGNTHAEQCCFIKLAAKSSCPVEELGWHLPKDTVLYTTMEPCVRRSVGNASCVERVLGLKGRDGRVVVRRVVVGVREPEVFVGVNEGRGALEQAGVEVVVVEGLEMEILEVATAGHVKEEEKDGG